MKSSRTAFIIEPGLKDWSDQESGRVFLKRIGSLFKTPPIKAGLPIAKLGVVQATVISVDEDHAAF